jgi:three-Cys-motif partner protein
VFWHDASQVDPAQQQRMTRYWGDESWRDVAYTTENDLFHYPRRTDNETIAAAFRDRLREVAGFSHVPAPIPMRNSTGATVYYLFFASPKAVAGKIVGQIFDKYRDYGRR